MVHANIVWVSCGLPVFVVGMVSGRPAAMAAGAAVMAPGLLSPLLLGAAIEGVDLQFGYRWARTSMPLTSVAAVHVGRVVGTGLRGMDANGMVLKLTDESEVIVWEAQYCNARCLREWAEEIQRRNPRVVFTTGTRERPSSA